MELFYASRIQGSSCRLDEEQTRHCLKVLRYKAGDPVNAIDGKGSLLACRIRETGKEALLEILSVQPRFGAHPYRLEMAVAPTKNMDRYEWFLEKATELGVDRIVPAIGEHSERRTVRADRLEKILIGAAKQSLKGAVPELATPASVRDFLRGPASPLPENGREPGGMQDLRHLKLIAYCGEAEKCSLRQALEQWQEQWQEQWREQTPVPEAGCAQAESSGIPLPRITILIGPEGDFSPQEVDCALAAGYRPVHLGASRLRTETAAVAAVAEVYFFFGNRSPF